MAKVYWINNQFELPEEACLDCQANKCEIPHTYCPKVETFCTLILDNGAINILQAKTNLQESWRYRVYPHPDTGKPQYTVMLILPSYHPTVVTPRIPHQIEHGLWSQHKMMHEATCHLDGIAADQYIRIPKVEKDLAFLTTNQVITLGMGGDDRDTYKQKIEKCKRDIDNLEQQNMHLLDQLKKMFENAVQDTEKTPFNSWLSEQPTASGATAGEYEKPPAAPSATSAWRRFALTHKGTVVYMKPPEETEEQSSPPVQDDSSMMQYDVAVTTLSEPMETDVQVADKMEKTIRDFKFKKKDAEQYPDITLELGKNNAVTLRALDAVDLLSIPDDMVNTLHEMTRMSNTQPEKILEFQRVQESTEDAQSNQTPTTEAETIASPRTQKVITALRRLMDSDESTEESDDVSQRKMPERERIAKKKPRKADKPLTPGQPGVLDISVIQGTVSWPQQTGSTESESAATGGPPPATPLVLAPRRISNYQHPTVEFPKPEWLRYADKLNEYIYNEDMESLAFLWDQHNVIIGRSRRNPAGIFPPRDRTLPPMLTHEIGRCFRCGVWHQMITGICHMDRFLTNERRRTDRDFHELPGPIRLMVLKDRFARYQASNSILDGPTRTNPDPHYDDVYTSLWERKPQFQTPSALNQLIDEAYHLDSGFMQERQDAVKHWKRGQLRRDRVQQPRPTPIPRPNPYNLRRNRNYYKSPFKT